MNVYIPMDPITLSEDDWGPKRQVFRFHYHSQKVIGSLGIQGGPQPVINGVMGPL